jgi:tRNA pseudouridine38-40 synthase
MHGHPVPTIGAGRTDSGVHAMGQVANFYTDIASIDARRFLPALNQLLPRDLRVLSASEADFDFHSRYDARLRRYRYFVLCSPAADPMRLRYAHHLTRRPSIESLNAEAALILGETDFTTFSAAKDKSANRSRFAHESAFRWEGDLLVYQVAANAFLWRMVRSLVGSMLEFEMDEARGGGAPCAKARMAEALRARDRSLAGATAPARGLFLWNVEYYSSPTRPGRGDYWSRGDYSSRGGSPRPGGAGEDGPD